jgi:hypothetical protein
MFFGGKGRELGFDNDTIHEMTKLQIERIVELRNEIKK